ncbi:MAG: MFS transporter [Microbacterium ginsengisoli]|nr:MFS transporter [Microbacterium ginsengisoli]
MGGERGRGFGGAVVRASLPNLAQWLNLYAYATFAPYFRHEFFAADDAHALVFVYGAFALAFAARPLGSWLFGRLADRRGRARALRASVLLMAVCTLVLALSPTHAAIGAGAAVVLLVASLVQGIAAGGEYAASAVYLAELAPAGRRGLFSSLQSATIVGGQVLAQAALLVLLVTVDRPAIAAWGWRAVFAVAALAAAASLLAIPRRAENAARAQGGSMRVLLREHTGALVWVILMTAGGTVVFYTDTVTLPTLARDSAFATGGAAAETAAAASVLVALVVLMLLQPIGGALSDRIGWRALLVFFGVGALVTTVPLLWLVPQTSSPWTLLGLLVGGFVVLAGYLSVNTVAKAEAFPPEVRALGVGFGYSIANSLFGGTAPMIYHASAAGGGTVGFTGYVLVLVAVSTVVYVFFTPRRAGQSSGSPLTSPRSQSRASTNTSSE